MDVLKFLEVNDIDPNNYLVSRAGLDRINVQDLLNDFAQLNKVEESWQLDRTEGFLYKSAHEERTYREVSLWVNPSTFEREEILRSHICKDYSISSAPLWAKAITNETSRK